MTNPENPQSIYERFPNMKPVDSAPSMFTLNGVGTRLYGRRDFDVETNTYVGTYCFCVLYIPLIAIGAYRVADAERGWYFLGKERLSKFARTWNKVVAAAALWGALQIGWSVYTSSESYKTGRELKAAAKQMAAHHPLDAASTYRRVAETPSHGAEVRQGLADALGVCLKSDTLKEVEGAYKIIASLPSSMIQPPVVPDAFVHGLENVERFRKKNPEEAITILDQVSRLNPKDARLSGLRIDLLKQTIAAQPGNTNRVVELALIYEEAQQLEEAQKVLLPCKDKLGSTEGARILGQYLLQQRQNEDAYKLLYPYVQTRLQRLHAVERSFTNAIASANRRAIEDLNKGRAGQVFYNEYKGASKERQDAMVNDFVRRAMETDGSYKRALAELKAANKIVHVTLDLGIIQLNRAQSMQDSAARKAELEAAEKTFLAIGGLAGDSDEYRLFLGQVYYWLGKSTQGKELFDQLLESSKHGYEVLMALSHTLREVGEYPQARELSEEAYRTAKLPKHRFAAASFRAHMQTDTDDQIAWLKKSDPQENGIQIALNNALGEKALADGNYATAADYLRKAIAGYESLPAENSASLNNCGLAYMALYDVTGKTEDYDKGVKLLERAVEMNPGNSVLLINTLHILYRSALTECVREQLHLEAIAETAESDSLGYLYSDEASRAALFGRLAASEKMKKATAYLDKALLLAPKQVGLYRLALGIHSGMSNLEELKRLKQRIAAAQLDFTEEEHDLQAFMAGTRDKELLQRSRTEIQRFEADLDKPAVQQRPALGAYVRGKINSLQHSASHYGAHPDTKKLLVLARTGFDQHPSAASQSAYASALLYRAHDELMEQNPDYRKAAEQLRRTTPPSHLIPCLATKGGSVVQDMRANANLQAAIGLCKERTQKFPHFARPVDWALLRVFDPAAANAIANHLKESEVSRLENEIELETNPVAAYAVLNNYFLHIAAGEQAKASEVYRAGQKRGVLLPEL